MRYGRRARANVIEVFWAPRRRDPRGAHLRRRRSSVLQSGTSSAHRRASALPAQLLRRAARTTRQSSTTTGALPNYLPAGDYMTVTRGRMAPRRLDLVEAAVPVFNQYGFHRSTMKVLASGAEMTGPSLYRHFASKEELLGAVIRHGTASVRELLDGATSVSGTPAARLRAVQVGLAALSVTKSPYGAVIQRDIRNLGASAKTEVRNQWHVIVRDLAQLLKQTNPTLSTWDAEMLSRVHFAIASTSSYSRSSKLSPPQQRKLTLNAMQAVIASECMTSQQWSRPPAVRELSVFREHTNKRSAIMSCATRLFGERGYHNVGMEDVAEAAGVTVPTVYAHFADKQELLLAGQNNGIAWLNMAIVNAIEADVSAHGRLLLALHAYAEFGIENTSLMAVNAHEILNLPDEAKLRGSQVLFVSELVGLLRADRRDLDQSTAGALVRTSLSLVNEITRTRRFLGRTGLIDELTRLACKVVMC